MATMNMDLPDLIPFPPETNAHIDTAREHLQEWVCRFGLVRKEAARRRFARADFAGFGGQTYPTADESDLQLVSDCLAWLFLLDDQLDDGSGGRDLNQVGGLEEAFAGILLGPHRPSLPALASPMTEVPLVLALSDLWQRLDGRTTEAWRWKFFRHVAAGAGAAFWEAENRVSKIIPDERTYIEKRRHTGAIYVCMDLIEVVERLDIPIPIYES
jgi:hypothetical protein